MNTILERLPSQHQSSSSSSVSAEGTHTPQHTLAEPTMESTLPTAKRTRTEGNSPPETLEITMNLRADYTGLNAYDDGENGIDRPIVYTFPTTQAPPTLAELKTCIVSTLSAEGIHVISDTVQVYNAIISADSAPETPVNDERVFEAWCRITRNDATQGSV